MALRRQFSIAIVGAGLAGLAAAVALRRLGFDAIIYELAERVEPLGAGMELAPNAVKALRGLSLEDRMRAVAFAPASLRRRDGVSGRVTQDQPLRAETEGRYGAPFLMAQRADLVTALAATLPAECIRHGKALAGLDANGPRLRLLFADGSEASADALIGADGVHSRVRDHVAGPQPAHATGRVVCRGVVPAARLRGEPVGTAHTTWWAGDRQVVVCPVTAARDRVHFSATRPVPPGGSTPESWTATGDGAAMRAAFARFHSDVQAVLAAAPLVQTSGIWARAPLAAWSRARVVLVGDAGHAMPPDLGASTAMALEDAVVLARCLAEMDDEPIEAALRAYEITRKPRTSIVQAGTASGTPARSEGNPDWLYGYDAWKIPLRATLDNY